MRMRPPNRPQQHQDLPFRPPGAFSASGPPFRPPLPPGRPPLPAIPLQQLRPPPPPFPPPGLPRPPPIPHMSADEQQVLERIATEYASRPAGIGRPEDIPADAERFGFMHPSSPLHPFFLWRVSQIRSQANGNVGRPPVPLGFRPPAPPPIMMRPPPPAPVGMPPLPTLGPPIPPPSVLAHQEPEPPKEEAEEKPKSTKRYYDLPASIMLAAIDESHSPYDPLHVKQLEDCGFLESVVPGLSTYADKPSQPDMTEDMEMALAHFDKGIRFIHNEGEFENQISVDMDMDREGWEPGVVERLLWDRRKSSAERKKWKRRQERARRREARQNQLGSELSGSSLPSGSESGSGSDSGSDSSSDSGSESDSDTGIHAMPMRAPPASMSRAIGSDNVGFKMLSKMGWKQGEGLGAMAEGIKEPIRPPTRFSASGSQSRGGGRGSRGKQRARGGKSRQQRTGSPPIGMEGEELYEDYRKHMSYKFNKFSGRMDDTDSS